jgi:uncharacterized protein (DUF2267 family)
MRFDEFIQRVQGEANLDTREQALAITEAVLETLGERLDREVRNGVEAQLPNEMKGFLLAREENADRYNLAEFYSRVAARAWLKYEDATEQTWQVLAVLRQAISGGEVQDMMESLPSDYATLFEQAPPKRR